MLGAAKSGCCARERRSAEDGKKRLLLRQLFLKDGEIREELFNRRLVLCWIFTKRSRHLRCIADCIDVNVTGSEPSGTPTLMWQATGAMVARIPIRIVADSGILRRSAVRDSYRQVVDPNLRQRLSANGGPFRHIHLGPALR
jgi:hypothetical protein